MNDRELLELAARAAGVVHPEVLAKHLASGWNPLTDDGDALRLAVKLRMCVDISGAGVFVAAADGPGSVSEFTDYRRAIVRAAAEIGRTLPATPTSGGTEGEKR